MKRIYIGILLIVSLVLAACGDTAAVPAEAPEATLSAVDLDIDSSELNVQSGSPLILPGFIGETFTFGRRIGENQADIVLRHSNFLARADNFSESDDQLKVDSAWIVVNPLAEGADETCFSLESVNYRGRYLRHSRSRVRLDLPNTTVDAGTFEADATWCLRTSLGGVMEESGFAFAIESFNFPARYMRRYDDRVWLSRPDGPLPTDDPANFETDAVWQLFTPTAFPPNLP